jgi:hypothetical protein
MGMAIEAPELKKSGTVAVSKYFRHDWQFIVDYLRTPLLKEAATAIAAAPAILDLNFIQNQTTAGISKAIGFTFVAAIAYIAFYLVGYLSCPKFVREYRDYGDYAKRQHSNRFIGWELMQALRDTGDSALIDELIEKGLARPLEEKDVAKITAVGLKRLVVGPYVVFGPNNIGVDLFIYFRREQSIFRLWLKDEKIDHTDTSQRNLFWVIYTRLTKSKPTARYTTWGLFVIAVGIFLVSVFVSLYRTVG